MQAELRLPADFSLYTGDCIISNVRDRIDYSIAEFIKGKTLFAQHVAWDYLGKVWWDEPTEYWCTEIWKDYEYQCTHMAPTLPELRAEVIEVHGKY